MSEQSMELKFLLLMNETDSFRTKIHTYTICVDIWQPIKGYHTGSFISDSIPVIKRESQKQSQYNVPVQCDAFLSSNIMEVFRQSMSEEPDVCVFSTVSMFFLSASGHFLTRLLGFSSQSHTLFI